MIFALLFVVWEFAVALSGIKEYLLPRPTKIWSEFLKRHDIVLGAAWVTTREIILGYLIAVVVSIPLALFFYGLFLVGFGRFAPAAFAGLLLGYLFYDMVHYATHHFSMKGGVWLWLKKYHMRHHYDDDHVGYGVSSPLWDYVFGTRAPRGQAEPGSLETDRQLVGTSNH